MKSKVALLTLVSLLFTFASIAQEIENDDMYFNSNDRAKLNAAKATQPTYSASIKKTKKEAVVEEDIANPTDSYSARNVNPEYQARSNSETAQADNQDYFVNNYQHNQASNFNSWNNNFNQWYSNPWYGGNYYDPFISSWNSPYYGSFYDPWGSPWGNPYYRSGWSSSFSYHWGNSWNYGWGMNFGFGNYYNPYNAWAGRPYYGYSPWGSYYGGWGYPNQVVIIESGNRYGPAYGKRSSRSTVGREYVNRSGRTDNRNIVNPDSNRPNTGGRVGTTTSRQSDYYNRSWRSESQNSYDNSNSGNNRSSWENNTRNSWRDSNSGGSSRTYDAGRSSTGGSSGGSSTGGSRSGGSSSGSRSSGRGN